MKLTKENILLADSAQINDWIDDYIIKKQGPYAGDFPKWSNDIAAAWKVVEKMAKSGWMLYKLAHTLSGTGKVDGCICIFLNIESGASREAFSNTASEAICESALSAVMEEKT